MSQHTTPGEFQVKPPIVSVVQNYVELKKHGKQHLGRCPFHDDRTPSFSVSEEKGVFHCFGCGAGGDVIEFIQLAEKVSFKQALGILHMTEEPKPRVNARQRQAAAVAVSWLSEQRQKIGVLLGDLLEQIEVADEIGDGAGVDSLLRQQSFLRDLYEDLEISRNAADMLSIRPMIDALTEGVRIPEIHFEFPELTPEYRARLRAIFEG